MSTWAPRARQVGATWPERLLSWFASARRDLPWRSEPRDPYRVWVSEIMLQQTRVQTVLRYYEPFLERFPDVRALAEAPEDELMKLWEGLGYYRRARLLQRGATHVAEHGMPEDRAGWLEVPGVGAYTAGAIASLAHGEPVAAVDGNVLRVFARMTRFEDDVATPAAKRAAEAWVHEHQPRRAPGSFNEALMELGATVCTPKAPRCDACPLRSSCRGRDAAEDLPKKAKKKAPREMEVALAIVRRGDRYLFEKRASGLLAGTWGFPWVEGGRKEIAARVAEIAGSAARAGERLATADHQFTHRTWRIQAYAVATSGRGGEWREPHEVALGRAHRKVLSMVARPA